MTNELIYLQRKLVAKPVPVALPHSITQALQFNAFLVGMEFYSTALWHLQKEVQLSALAQHLTELDKNCPEVSM